VTIFNFRIKCYLPRTQGFEGPAEGTELFLPDSEKLVKLISPREKKELWVTCEGISSKTHAEVVGQRVKKALSLCSASLQLGIDVGRDTPPSSHAGFRAPGHDKSATVLYNPLDGPSLMPDDVHGLVVYPARPHPVFASINISDPIQKPMPLERLGAELEAHYGKNPLLTAKQELALELYSASHYEASKKTRFLALITIVEVLAERLKQPDQIQDLINDFLKITAETDLEEKQKEAFQKQLENLKQQSITSACRALTKQHLGPEGEKIFKAYYALRGKLVHTGDTKKVESLDTVTSTLDLIVSRLLLGHIYNERYELSVKGGKIPGFTNKT
jgi:Apea-like HEPN